LGHIFYDLEGVHEIRDILPPQAFYWPVHGKVYEALIAAASETNKTSTIEIRDRMKLAGHTVELFDLEEMVTRAAFGDVRNLAEIIVEKSRLRSLFTLGQKAMAEAFSEHPSESVAANIQSGVANMELTGSNRLPTALELIPEALKRRRTAFFFGFKGLDEICQFSEGDLGVLAARTSIGKTALATQIILQATRNQRPVGTLLVTTENQAWKVVRRALTHIQQRRWREVTADIDGFDSARLANLWIDDRTVDVDSICSRARGMRARGEIGLVVVDLLKHCTDAQRSQNENLRLANMMRKFKRLAKDVPTLLIHQLSRPDKSKGNQPPQLTDLRESGHIEEDAQLVLMLHQTDYTQDASDPRPMELFVRKQSTGPRDISQLFTFYPETMTFTETS